MTLNATAGAADANSYVTVTDASAILAARLDTAPWDLATNSYVTVTDASAILAAAVPWDRATTSQQEAALQWATRLLDTMVSWYGWPATVTQALAWPQTGQSDHWARPILTTIVPAVIKEATALFAVALLQEKQDQTDTSDYAGVDRLRMGDLEMQFSSRSALGASSSRLPLSLRLMLRWYGEIAGDITLPLWRA